MELRVLGICTSSSILQTKERCA